MNLAHFGVSKTSSDPRAAELGGRKLTVLEVATYLNVSKSFLDKKRLDGGGPPYLKLGRRVVYDRRDLENWAASNKRHYTARRQKVL